MKGFSSQFIPIYDDYFDLRIAYSWFFIQYPFVFNESSVFDVKFDQILEFFML